MSTVALERSKTYFEQFVGATPDPLKGFTQAVLWPFEQLLELVAGDPDDLIRGAQVMLDGAEAVRGIAREQRGDRAALASPAWSGDASQACQLTLHDIEKCLDELATSIDMAKEVLVEAAEQAVDAFNLLCELIFEFLVAFLIEAIIAAAAAVLSAGASVAAFIVRWVARLAMTLGRASRIVMKLVRILVKLSSKLKNVAKVLKAYRERVMELRTLKKQFKPWTSAARSPAGKDFWREYAKKVIAPKMAFNLASPVNLPGKFGAGLDTVMGAHDLASDGDKDRNYVVDGTYREDLGRFTGPLQNLIDTGL